MTVYQCVFFTLSNMNLFSELFGMFSNISCLIVMPLVSSSVVLPQIIRIGNVSHLTRLRVLNLAGNEITRVDNLHGLDALTELNLQRNCISSVVSGSILMSE